MRFNMKKIAALAMAATMCLPMSAFAAQTSTATSGTWEAGFGVYSPTLSITVPVRADIQVNPLVDTTDTNTAKTKYTVSSNSIDVVNSTMDGTEAIPVNVTAQATITSVAEGVKVEYNTFTLDKTSKEKRIFLQLAEATTAADPATGAGAAYDRDNLPNTAAVTAYGSLLSVDIDPPTNATTPAAGSFAVVGEANTNADWADSDVAVSITYNVKASNALEVKTPTVAELAFTAGTGAQDVKIVVPDVGEATVAAMALHNTGEDLYGDFIWEDGTYTVAYAPNASTATQTDATITIAKDSETLDFLTTEGYNKKSQDLVIALSDGRMVVTKLTCTKN